MKRYALPFFLFLLLSTPAFAEPKITVENSEDPSAQPLEEAFRTELGLVSRKSLRLAKAIISPVKKINDSYHLTAQAVSVLADSGDIRAALPLLRDAAKQHEGNRLAHLLLGYAQEKLGNAKEAARSYNEFYKNSLTLVQIEAQLIRPASLHVFRDYAEARLKALGMPPPKAKVSGDLHQMRSLVMLEDSKLGQMIHLILPIMLIAGLVLLVLAWGWGIDLSGGAWYFLLSFYGLALLGYGLWAAHFFCGLPFWISLETEVKIFLGAGIGGIILIYVVFRFLEDQHEIRSEGMTRCSHCRKVISQMDTQCPECGKKQD